MEDIVIETIFFNKPPEWGCRIIQRGREILPQGTEDGGRNWHDMPILGIKLILPDSQISNSTVKNRYEGLIPEIRVEQQNRGKILVIDLGGEFQSAVNSGTLLKLQTNENRIEAITFLGTYKIIGLASGDIWYDSNNKKRIVL